MHLNLEQNGRIFKSNGIEVLHSTARDPQTRPQMIRKEKEEGMESS